MRELTYCIVISCMILSGCMSSGTHSSHDAELDQALTSGSLPVLNTEVDPGTVQQGFDQEVSQS